MSNEIFEPIYTRGTTCTTLLTTRDTFVIQGTEKHPDAEYTVRRFESTVSKKWTDTAWEKSKYYD